MSSYSYKKRNKLSLYDKRLVFVLIVCITFAIIIIGRLFFLQILNGKKYKDQANRTHQMEDDLIAQRGEIFIREFNTSFRYPIATNQITYRVIVEPSKIQNKQQVVKLLANSLSLDESELIDIVSKNDPYERIADHVSQVEVDKIKEYGLKGVVFESEVRRFYPEDNFGGQILGFVGFDKDRPAGSGRYGLEGYFDKELAGVNGYIKGEKDAFGNAISLADQTVEEVVEGVDLELTIDRGIQFFICTEINEAIKTYDAESGSILVMDPNKGSILGMCSTPDYNPNEYNKIKDQSLFVNPAIFNQYEPGSIMKPITMAAGIDAGVVNPETTYEDTGSVYIKPYTIKNSDGKANGVQTMTQVLEKSLNTGVIYVVELLGPDRYRQYMENFGFGDLTGVELDTEVGGDISSLKKNGEIWSATASFGQGIAVTSLQMLNAFNVIANGGKLMKPYIVEKKIDGNGNIDITESKIISQVISSRSATLLRGMLTSVVEFGHASLAKVPGYYIGGKTGTAQISKKGGGGYEEDQKITTFVGFAPVDKPRFSILIKMDNPKNVEWASSSAAPVFADVAKFILNYYKIPPER